MRRWKSVLRSGRSTAEEFCAGAEFSGRYCFEGLIRLRSGFEISHDVRPDCFSQGFREVGGIQYRPFASMQYRN